MENLENGKEAVTNPTDSTLFEQNGHGAGSERERAEHDGPSQERPLKKPLAFHMSFLALLIMGFICALDATVLGVAIPVCFPLQ